MKTVLRLLQLISPFKWWIVLAVLLGSATVASGVGLLAVSAYLISAAALHPSIAELQVAIVGVRFFGISRGVFRYLERYVSHTVTLRLLTRWRVWFYQALEPLAPARLQQFQAGDLLARAVGDIETLQEFYVRVVAPPAVALVVGVGMLLWLSTFSPVLSLILGLSWLLAAVALPLSGLRFSAAPAQVLSDTRSALNARLVDSIQGMPEILAFGQGGRAAQEIDALAREYGQAQTKLAGRAALQNALGMLLSNLAMLAVLAVAIQMAADRTLNGVYLAALALATLACFEAALPLSQAAHSLSAALVAARRLFAIVDAAPAVTDPSTPAPAVHYTGLELRGLRFAYDRGAVPLLDGLEAAIKPGTRVAIVGPSGAGKTTMVNLLMRFWDYEGRILLGGRELREYPQSEIRSVFGLISQQTYLFGATLRENLLIARPDAAQSKLDEAVHRAQLEPFLRSLPRGYDTWVGERGVRISGGERQRLAIARALLRPTPILILDEPTANLDAETERELLRSLFSDLAGRTILLVTHRLVELHEMDELFVLDRGRFVERGTEEELLRKQGLYHRLWMLQNRAILQD